MRPPFTPLVAGALLGALGAVALGGCGRPGEVTFTIRAPAVPELDPVSDRVSAYSLQRTDGTVIGVVSEGPSSPQTLPIGPLPPTPIEQDLVLQVLSGSELLGMARVRDVSIRPGQQRTYVAEVRKPLIFVGSALPDESTIGNALGAGQAQDPTSSTDLAEPGASGAIPLALPSGMAAPGVTSDGRFLLAGRKMALAVVDTASGLTVGEAPLGFTPSRVLAGARDTAVVALDPAGAVALFVDVPGLTSAPASAAAMIIPLPGGTRPRAAAFSTDGKRLYVLTGDPAVDPCAADAAPPANSILIMGVDGSMVGAWTLPDFAADIGVQQPLGRVVVSRASAGQVGTIDPATAPGAVTPTKLMAALCPTALAVNRSDVFVVTSERDPNAANAFLLRRASVTDGAMSVLSFPGPYYDRALSGPGDVAAKLQLKPRSVSAYAMDVTPDGSRAVFATRARYREKSQSFDIIGLACTITVDAVEYGLYSLDTRTGNASYGLRSRNVVSPPQQPDNFPQCGSCPSIPLDLHCPSAAGDRAGGVTAIFGRP